jgi:pyruvate carboxylase
MGGWPPRVVKAVLGTTKPKRPKPAPVKLKEVQAEVAVKTKREANEDDLYSHLMYPQVFADFVKFQKDFSDVGVLPTPAFFYGLQPGEDITKLINIGSPDKDGRRVISYELNGMPREATVVDKSIAPKAKPKVKAATGDPLQVGAPIPGMITLLNATVGGKVKSGDKIATLEAMKMQTSVYAHADGVIAEVLTAVGDSVESGDLLVRLRE